MNKNKKIALYNLIESKLKKRVPIKKLEHICERAVEHYLLETKDSCYCSSCRREFSISKLDKHNSKRKCPMCKKTVTVQRNNGRSCINEHISIAYTELIDGYLVLRYYFFNQFIDNRHDGKEHRRQTITEVGRQILGERVNVRAENAGYSWYIIGDSDYAGSWFSISKDTFRWYENKYCIQYCLMERDSRIRALSMINQYAFNAYNKLLKSRGKRGWNVNTSEKAEDWYSELFVMAITNNEFDICEKFVSCGLSSLYVDLCKEWSPKEIHRFNRDDSIKTILKMDSDALKWFITTDKSISTYHRYTEYRKRGLSLCKIKSLINAGCAPFEYDELCKMGHVFKKINYMVNQKITVSEYLHYIDNLKSINASMDKSNLYPSDFNKADIDLAIQLDGAGNNKRVMKVAEKIKKAMSKSSLIRELCNGSQGFIVKVPETEEELIREGKKMHNCLGTYGNSVGRGKTQIFFIRKIEEPDKPFYAMEYCNGEIRQLYTYNNKHDERYEEVRVFALSFVDFLSKVMKKRRCNK